MPYKVAGAVHDIFLEANVRQRPRAGLTIGQTGQLPGASRLEIKTRLYWFFILIGCSPRVKIVELFDYCF